MHLAAAYVLADTAYAGTADLSNRVEIRARDTQGVLGVDLADTPSARIAVTNRRWDYLLEYSAIAVLPDVELGLSPQLLHLGDVGVSWHARRVRIGLSEYASYGQQNSGFLLGGPSATTVPSPTPPTVAGGTQLLVQPVTLLYGSSRTVLSSQFVISRRWSGTAAVEYDVQGGLDAASRTYFPFVSGPRADASATYALTRIDALETRASALSSTATSAPCSPIAVGVPAGSACDPSDQEATMTETWRHRLAPTWQSSVGAGASYLRARLRDVQPYEQLVYPVGSVGVEHATGPVDSHSFLRVEALVAPVLDVRLGLLDERGQMTLNVSQRFGGNVTVTGVVAAARSIDSPLMQPSTVFQASVDTEVRLSPVVSVGGGVRYIWQEQTGIGTFSGGFFFGAVTFSAPTIRF